MNLALTIWYAVGDFTVPKIVGEESAALLILAASLLVFRTFRERYLLVWILGWLAYFVSHWTVRGIGLDLPPTWLLAISQAEFLLAACLFATAVLIYSHARDFLLPLFLVSVTIIGYAVAIALFRTDSMQFRIPLEVAYRLILLGAGVRLIRFRWARGEIGPWFLALSLLLLHLDWAPLTPFLPPGFELIAEMLLGLSMLLVVFDDSRERTRRLAVINALTGTIARAQQHGPMMATALEELKGLLRAKAAWFRLFENDQTVITAQIGLSPEFLHDRSTMKIEETLSNILREGKPTIIKTADANESMKPHMKWERFRHVIVVPVVGKKSAIGTLALGSKHHICYTPDDLEFLSTAAHQLGLAVENLRLVEQILRSHRQWSNTFDSIQDLVLLHDSEFRVMKANHALLQRLGKAPADLMGNTCESVLPKDHGEWSDCPYCLGSFEEGFHEGPDPCFGGFSMISTSSYTDQNSKQRGTIHVVRDATDRRVAEEKYRMLFEQVQEGVFVTTPAGQLLDCNDAFVRMLGYSSRDEVMPLNVETALYASAEQREVFRREVEVHNYVRNFEVTLRRKDGSLLSAVESSFASRNVDGKIERYQGFLLDVSEKKRAEEEIHRRNRELNALNAMAVVATQSFDLDEILNLTLRQVITLFGAETGSIYLNDLDETTFRRRAGWGPRSAERARLSEIIFTEGFGDLVTRSRTEVISEEFLPHLPTQVKDFIQADGLPSWIWVLLWSKDKPMGLMGISNREARQYTNNDENLLVAIGRQLATTIEKVRLYEETCRAYEDLRRTQEQLLQSEKMSAVGQLISGVAHELNNPLTAILGYAQLLESEGLADRAADYVKKLFKQAQRTHRVVQNLLSFARQRKPQKQQVEIRRVLEETLALRDYDLKVNDIEQERDFEESIPTVIADPHQLEQVFLNVINNAVDAMLEEGKGGSLKVRIYAKDGHVYTEFRDSGPGIKELNRIFDPFYTTKSVGKGTGLGLSICYGIIKEHGGDITAHNRSEGGAIVEIRLPAAAQAALANPEIHPPKRELAVEGRILLVEDEEAVLEFERDVLAGAGARVVTLMNAEEVKNRLKSERFDAIIINGKMPGNWDAGEIHRWLCDNAAGMEKHVLFTFSNLAEPEIRAFLNHHNIPYLVKPFEVADLISQARRLLVKTQAASAS
ncbi:MAG TPA: GAF domain-containing protein [Terriglobales bacterium]|jgi:two-component system NtrC family sensor kinase